MLVGSLPVEEKPIIPSRRDSRAGSLSIIRRISRGASFSQSATPLSHHAPFIHEALIQARVSASEDGIPIGAVLVHQGQIVARGHDRRLQRPSTVLTAEMDCFETAGHRLPDFYRDCTLYTTVAPNAIAVGTIRFLGIPRVVIGEDKNSRGDEALLRASQVQVEVLDSFECRVIMEEYLRNHPSVWQDRALIHPAH